MTKAVDNHANKTVLGAGEVYIDVLGDGAVRTGERYVGDSTGASISATTERTTIFSGDGAVARVLLDKVTSVNHSMSVTIQDMQPENFALFLAGDVAEVTDSSTAVTKAAPEKITVKAGRWYQFGVANTAAARAGVASVSSVVIKKAATGSEKAGAFDALPALKAVLDAERGRFLANEDGIALVTYTPGGQKRMRASAGEAKEIKAAVRYIEDDASGLGAGSNWYIRQATVGPAGELALKDRTTPQSISLQILIEVPAIDGEPGHPAILVDGAPYSA